MAPPAAGNKCPNCQTPRRPGAEFCSRCGCEFPPPGSRNAGQTDEDDLPLVVSPPLSTRKRRRLLGSPLLIGFGIFVLIAAAAALAVQDLRLPLVILGVGALVVVIMLVVELLS